MAFLSADDIIVLDRDAGKVFRIIDGVQSKPLLDVNVATVGYRGLLGVAVSANEKNILNVFLYYTQAHKRDSEDESLSNPVIPLGNRVYRYDLVNNRLENPKLLLDLPAMPGPRHMGGIIAIGPDDNLYVSVGDLDGTFRGKKYTLWHKIIKTQLLLMGAVVYFELLRMENQLVMAFLVINRHLICTMPMVLGTVLDLTGIHSQANSGTTENGPHFGDEINLVQPGFNSGWVKVQGIWEPNFEQMGKIVHNPNGLNDFNGNGTYNEPKFTWIPTVAPTAMTFLNSDKYGSEHRYDLIVGDANTGTIYYFKLNANRDALQLEGKLKDRIADNLNELKKVKFATGFGRITDIKLGSDGLLYVLSTQKSATSIYRISSR